jgi:hypothetical protein
VGVVVTLEMVDTSFVVSEPGMAEAFVVVHTDGV